MNSKQACKLLNFSQKTGSIYSEFTRNYVN